MSSKQNEYKRREWDKTSCLVEGALKKSNEVVEIITVCNNGGIRRSRATQ
jgi:hypothetical protein